MDQTQNKSKNRYLYLAVFASGTATMAVEFSASRLLGNVFGTSNLVWANVIGLILLYLTVGYFIGGRWADRSPFPHTLYKILIWAAFLSALIPLVSSPVLYAAGSAVADAEAALVVGSFISILVLFSIPVTLLGCTSPFAIRLAIQDPADAGKISGQIYAISTLGSLMGTFIPALLTIPRMGTLRTFLFFGGILYLVAIIGLWQHTGKKALIWLWMPIVIAILSILTIRDTLRSPDENATVLYSDESAYNYIQVEEDSAGYRYLYLNEGQGVHSIWHASDYSYDGTWDMFLAAPYFNNPPYGPSNFQRLLVIGLATGTIPRQHIHVYGTDVPMEGIEIDPDIIEVGAEYFDMNTEQMPNLTVYAQDARYEISQMDHQYSVIAIDAYRPPYIPWHLTTVEFFEQVRDRLTDNGVVAINVGRTPTDRRLVNAMTNTLAHVFPTVHAIDVPRSFNTILVATQQPTTSANLIDNYNLLPGDAPSLLREVIALASTSLVQTDRSDVLFTDDHAPVEMLVDSLVLNFLLEGDLDDIR